MWWWLGIKQVVRFFLERGGSIQTAKEANQEVRKVGVSDSAIASLDRIVETAAEGCLRHLRSCK